MLMCVFNGYGLDELYVLEILFWQPNTAGNKPKVRMKGEQITE
jgi:hypothetical protein